MCGIAGFLSGKATGSLDERRHEILALIKPLTHRGPDAGDVWLEPDADIALGFRRLAIIDLSPAGNQPMASHSGRYVIAYNGEIYNFQELRDDLGSHIPWRGSSDTEVLVEAIERFGVVEALKKLTGMFALAVWDRRDRELWLARDRFGEKPLYYTLQRGNLMFASELRSFLTSGRFEPRISGADMPQYVRFNYFPGTSCVFEDTLKLKPGHYARIPYAALQNHKIQSVDEISVHPFWDAEAALAHAHGHQFRGSIEDAADELDNRLSAIIKRQIVADVPVGAFLSGGIDSSSVTALMGKHTSQPPKTFTIGYNETGFDESPYACAVAKHLGTDHTQLLVKSKAALDLIPTIGALIDEPLADQSHIPTLLVSQLARTKVTVALTGDGGDELLGGYVRHSWIDRVWRYTGRGSPALQMLSSGALGLLSLDTWDRIGILGTRFKLGGLAQTGLGLKVQKLRVCLRSKSEEEIYQRLTSHWYEPGDLFANPSAADQYPSLPKAVGDTAQKAMFWDMMTYLPGDVLAKVDRASMAHSLETRAPFLDHTLAEWAWSLPTSFKVNGTTGKVVLRRVLERYVLPKLFQRPKQGFGLPVSVWLRGPLRDWAENLLDESRLKSDGHFEPRAIRAAWARHLSGAADMSHALWSVLMFQSWLDQNLAPALNARKTVQPEQIKLSSAQSL